MDNQVTRSRTSGSGLQPAISPLDLPYRELNETANFEEFTRETANGTIIKPIKSNVTGHVEKYKLVTFKVDDAENPKNWSKLYKWYCTMVVAFTCFVVAFNSSVITADLIGVEESFGVSETVSLLTITVFVIGFGVGMCILLSVHFQLLGSADAHFLFLPGRTNGVCTTIRDGWPKNRL
jgi:hypothetical protein